MRRRNPAFQQSYTFYNLHFPIRGPLGKTIGTLCGVSLSSITSISILTYLSWDPKQDITDIEFVCLPQENKLIPDISEERAFVSLLPFKPRKTGDNRPLNLDIQPTWRNHFHTVYSSGPTNRRIHDVFRFMNILGGIKPANISARDFKPTRPTDRLRWNIYGFVNNPAE